MVHAQVRRPNSQQALDSIGSSVWGLVDPFHARPCLEDLALVGFVRKAVYLPPNSIVLLFSSKNAALDQIGGDGGLCKMIDVSGLDR